MYSTGRPLTERGYAYSVSGGAGGHGTRISTATLGTRIGSSFGGGYDYQSSSFGSTSGVLGINNEKVAMQHLNDRLATYLETVRNLEKANSKLEIKIREHIENTGPLEGRDYSKYNTTIMDLRAKVSPWISQSSLLMLEVSCLVWSHIRVMNVGLHVLQTPQCLRIRKWSCSMNVTNVIMLVRKISFYHGG